MLKEDNSAPKKKRKLHLNKPDINIKNGKGEILFFVKRTKKNI